MRLGGIVQARMGSSRLPGKVLRRLAGQSVLGRVVRAVQAADAVDDLVVATTSEPEDDAVVAECRRLGVASHRGPVEDVLSRFLGAIDRCPVDAVLRLTADCPLLDPEIIRVAADVFRAVPSVDYLSTALHRTLPRGMDVEIVTVKTLRTIDRLARDHHRTHVTSYIYTHPERFQIIGLTFSPDPPEAGNLRVTLDTEPDWRLIAAIAERFGNLPVPFRTLTEWLIANPEVRAINAHVQQKALELA